MTNGHRLACFWVALAAYFVADKPTEAAISAGELVRIEPNLVFGTSFEDGISLAEWNLSGNAPVLTSEQTRSGSKAMKSYLHRYNSNTSYRTEVSLKGPEVNATIGKEYWYGFSIYLPSPYPADNISEILAQWHSTPDPGEENQNPPLSLAIENGQWKVKTIWNTSQPTLKSLQQSASVSVGQQATDQWTDWVFRVKWSYGSDGYLQVWKNGTQVVSRTGPNYYRDSKGPYFKMGIYKSMWRQAQYVGTVTSRVMYHDEFRMAGAGASYADVAPAKKSGVGTAAARPKPPAVVSIQ